MKTNKTIERWKTNYDISWIQTRDVENIKLNVLSVSPDCLILMDGENNPYKQLGWWDAVAI